MAAPIARLGDVADYIRGITFKPTDVVSAHSPGSVVCMTTKNIQEQLDETKLTAVGSRFVKRPDQYLQAGDTLVSSANSWNLVGKVSFVPRLGYEATGGGFISIVRARPNQADPRYLYHWLASPQTQHAARACARQTTNIANLDRSRFLNLRLPLPSLQEQRRIAAILDKADAVRRKRQQTLDLADQFLRSAFLGMFGDPVPNPKRWPVKKLGDCLARKPQIGTIAKADESGAVPVVRVGDLGTPWLPRSVPTRISLAPAEIARYRMEPGDLLLARAIGCEEHLGKAAVAPEEMPGGVAVFDSHVMCLRLDSAKLSPVFLWHWLKSPGGRALFLMNAGRTAVQFNVNAAQIARIEIPLPPTALQAQFVETVSSVGEAAAAASTAVRECERLFGAIRDRAFGGEL